jgi:hypothetical protein
VKSIGNGGNGFDDVMPFHTARSTIQGNIARDGHQTHVRNSSFFRDGKLNRKFALLHLVGFRDKFEPVIFHVGQHALHVRTEIHASRIAQNFDGSRLTPVAPTTWSKPLFVGFSSEEPADGPPSLQDEMENFAQTQKYCKTAAHRAS